MLSHSRCMCVLEGFARMRKLCSVGLVASMFFDRASSEMGIDVNCQIENQFGSYFMPS